MTPVAEIVEEARQGVGLLEAVPALVTRDAMDGDGRGVVAQGQQRVERVVETNLAALNRHGADRDQPVGARIEAGRFRVEDDEPYLIDGCVGRQSSAIPAR